MADVAMSKRWCCRRGVHQRSTKCLVKLPEVLRDSPSSLELVDLLSHRPAVARRMCHSEAFQAGKYWLDHPENYLCLISKNIFLGSEYPKILFFHYENCLTDVSDSAFCFQNQMKCVLDI